VPAGWRWIQQGLLGPFWRLLSEIDKFLPERTNRHWTVVSTKEDVDGKWRVSYEVIGHPPNVAVPTHFYKVIFAEDGKTGGNVSLGAFVLPNAVISNAKPLQDFEVPLEAVERASGLEFASLLPPARRKRLCEEVSCSIIVKEYAERQRTMMTPPPQKGKPPSTTMTQQ